MAISLCQPRLPVRHKNTSVPAHFNHWTCRNAPGLLNSLPRGHFRIPLLQVKRRSYGAGGGGGVKALAQWCLAGERWNWKLILLKSHCALTKPLRYFPSSRHRKAETCARCGQSGGWHASRVPRTSVYPVGGDCRDHRTGPWGGVPGSSLCSIAAMYKILDKSLSFLSSKRRQEEHPPSEGFCEPVPGKVSEWELDRCKHLTSVGFYY